MSKILRPLAPLAPYIAVGIGFYAVHSAWVALIGYHILIVILLSLAKAWPERSRLALPDQKLWLVPGLSGLVGGLLLYFLWDFAINVPDPGGKLVSLGLNAATWPVFIVYFNLVNPWLEEIYWRSWLGSASRNLTAHDAWFGGYHLLIIAPFAAWGWLPFALVFLSTAGWLMRQITDRSSTLFSAVLIHFIADVSIILTIYLQVRT